MVICVKCGCERHPASKPGMCKTCKVEENRIANNKIYVARLDELGYDFVSDETCGTFLFGNKRNVRVHNRECNHEFVAQLANILNGVSKCGHCGPTKRAAVGLAGFIAKHGRDYDLKKWNDYLLYVRRLSEKTYKEHIDLLNPDNLNRTRHDFDRDCVHLDHLVPIIEGFKNSIDPEIMASLVNLRIVNGTLNARKNKKLTLEAEMLLESWK